MADAPAARRAMHAAPTESAWARSAKLTEFTRLKDTVRRLEHSSKEQIALEQESQHVFEYLKGAIERDSRFEMLGPADEPRAPRSSRTAGRAPYRILYQHPDKHEPH